MPLRELAFDVTPDTLPVDAAEFIREAEDRIDRFQSECRVPAFVPCDYRAAFGVLRTLSDGALTRGRRFCEWGSGFGVVVGLAALLDFDACGIEIEELLVAEARKLAEDFGLPVEFVQGSFVPPGAEDRVHASGTYSWLTTEGDYAYDDLDLEVRDLDVVFAYPWPDEEVVVCDLFDRYAGVGAILATYHGSGEFRLKRKVSARKRRRG
ncbi:MAG: class I SAM-dependent methyltransferase [Planctomycetes bacterium]|nr:class I SAM-dependent methyltransferase [Planctomycetota bacterium]